VTQCAWVTPGSQSLGNRGEFERSESYSGAGEFTRGSWSYRSFSRRIKILVRYPFSFSGRMSRRFKSCHPDHNLPKLIDNLLPLTVRGHKAALFRLNQFGVDEFEFLLRLARSANEVSIE
jgi:hypothetical protein